jgi:site-specific recombinase XerD
LKNAEAKKSSPWPIYRLMALVTWSSATIQRAAAYKCRRRNLVQFLTRPEVDALLAAPDQRTWSGRRDHAFILLATGYFMGMQIAG